jgi:tryptophan 2,3-dioxygenase
MDPNVNWWFFQTLAERDDALMPEMVLLPAPPAEKPRHDIAYDTYLQLDKILTAQRPLSRVPDERAFVIVHQLFELAFKLMLFDCAAVERAFADILCLNDDDFRRVVMAPTPIDRHRWVPARTAAARLRFSAKSLLPTFFGIVHGEQPTSASNASSKPAAAVTFDSTQFERFRFRLPPASGFQSAQFRAIQRAFGKAPLLTIEMFGPNAYDHHYHGRTNATPRLTTVDHPDILRSQADVAAPTNTAPGGGSQRLIATTRALLVRLGTLQGVTAVEDTRPSRDVEVAAAVGAFSAMVTPSAGADADKLIAKFVEQLNGALEVRDELGENDGLAKAAVAALDGQTELVLCLRDLSAADERLFSSSASPFLSRHRNIASAAGVKEQQDGKPDGTAGGGMAFLDLSIALHLLFVAFPFAK